MNLEFLDLLNSRNYSQYNRALGHEIGLAEAILLSELIGSYLYHRSQNALITIEGEDGWFYETAEKIFERTCMKKKMQDGACMRLVEKGLIKTLVKGLPPTKHFLLNFEEIKSLFKDISPNFDKSENLKCQTGKFKTTNGKIHNIYEPEDEPEDSPPKGGTGGDEAAPQAKATKSAKPRPKPKPKEPDTPYAEFTETRVREQDPFEEYEFLKYTPGINLTDQERMDLHRFPVANVKEAIGFALEQQNVRNMAGMIHHAMKAQRKPKEVASMPFSKSDILAFLDMCNERMKMANLKERYEIKPDGLTVKCYFADYVRSGENSVRAIPEETECLFYELYDKKTREIIYNELNKIAPRKKK